MVPIFKMEGAHMRRGEREMGERLLVIGAVRSGGLISYHGKQ